MEADGVCTGVLTLVPTPVGKTMQTLVRHGKMGISSRGFGTTTERKGLVDGKRVNYLEVNDDFEMVTPGDFVVAPSVAGAGNIVEEIQNLESQLNKVDDDSRKKTDEERLIAVAKQLVEQGKFETVEKALEVINKEPETERKRLFTAEKVAYEAGFAGVPVQEMVKKLNENLGVRIKEMTKKEYFLMQELRDAGVIGSFEELLKKVRQMEQLKKILV